MISAVLVVSAWDVLQNSTVIIPLLLDDENEGLHHDKHRAEIAQLAQGRFSPNYSVEFFLKGICL